MINIFKHIEFDKIKTILQRECHSEMGSKIAESLVPLQDRNMIINLLELADQAKTLISKGISYNFEDLSDLVELLFNFRYENYNYQEFTTIYKNITTANRVRLDAEFEEISPDIYQRITRLNYFTDLTERYQQIFDPEGNVKDNASPKLNQLRSRKRRVRKDIVSFLGKRADQLHSESKSFDTIVTKREGRFMIPVKEGAATFIKGIVHGRSASKASVYMEPAEVVQQNNELHILGSDEKQEIKRIFVEYTACILAEKGAINDNSKILQELDYNFAVGRFSLRIGGHVPQICSELEIKLFEARHPILIESFKSIKKVIPFSLELGIDFKLLIISGPNTGGKTVTLKSIGLLTIMALSGLPISASAESKIGLFHSFFADIGDQQSLEDSLSTFSSHIKNINQMITKGDTKSLVLIDEIGAATDPEQGSALAQAVLEKLTVNDVTGVITTHYTALKIFAEKHKNCINASMQFDPDLHTPTYNFKLGLPGNSFAIEVAANLGFNRELIDRARELSGNQNVELTDLLTKMSEEKKELAKQKYKYELNNALLRQKVAEQQRKVDELEQSKKDVRKKSMKDAREYLTQLQKELNNEISSIQKDEREKRKEKFQKSLSKVNNLNRELGQKVFAMNNRSQTWIENPEIGQRVWVKSFDAIGEIIQISAKNAKIDMDGIFFTVDLKDLYYPKAKAENREIIQSSGVSSADYRTELKILGMIFEESRPEIDKFIDDALINGLDNIRIVHGKGTGALRSKVRQYLRKTKKVDSFRAADNQAGGDGVTVVSLKK